MAEIHGVELRKLVEHPDERGYFREVIRVTDPFFGEGVGQWSHSRMKRDVVKAWHFHHRQVGWWYIRSGAAEVALYDMRKASPPHGKTMVFRAGEGSDPMVIRIPPGVAHGCQSLADETHLFYVTSRTYDPDDEGRYPFDWDGPDHYWHEPVVTVDTRRFEPPHTCAPFDALD